MVIFHHIFIYVVLMASFTTTTSLFTTKFMFIRVYNNLAIDCEIWNEIFKIRFKTCHFEMYLRYCLFQTFQAIPIKFRIYKINDFLNIDFYMKNPHRLMYGIILTLDPGSYCKIYLSRPMEKSTKGNESSGTPQII